MSASSVQASIIKRDPPADPALLKVLAWFLILIALPFAWFAFSRAHSQVSSHSWPMASAEVLSSSIYQRTGRRKDWCVKVSYRYRVQERLYTRNRPGVSIVGNSGCDVDKSVVQQWLSTLAPGSAVVVHYNPADPTQAAIQLVGLDMGDYVLCIVPLVFFATGAWGLRQAKKMKPL
ncbi:DUF3592 domain-containing protein [Massilia sp. MB5]|uniref:DUF3592 domain-containing protein n=1 Tax=Massilia sp. MB5 TaxID=2919578 RepID=UPI001F0FABEE|nr:DUF3592 domain-containing protein [Massilia sp. MB5]UMR28636.1 DUF3592 domain-containing protein [Massilia sp. MB5]